MNWLLRLTARITAWQLLKKHPRHPVERTELFRQWKGELSKRIKA